ncbi:MAG: MFS transporter [Actinomycetota bacterium]|nr:MFS transporter [Actinomycetota bacterium]
MLSPDAEPLAGSTPSTAAVLADASVRATHRRAVWVLVAAQITGGLGIGAAISVGGLLALDISGSEVLAGGASTASTLGAALLALPLAAVAARSGRRHGLSMGWGLAALGTIIVILAAILGSYVVLMVGMLLTGSGAATSFQSRYAATDLALPTRRGRDLSIVVWSMTLGTVLGPNLSGPGADVAAMLDIPPLVGPFVFCAVGMTVAASLILIFMRPDPLLLSAQLEIDQAARNAVAHPYEPDVAVPAGSIWSTVWRIPRARLGMAAIVLGHAVMAAVMTMTPIHLSHHGATLTIVGLTISLHILGMFAFSPVFGWLADRAGRVTTILIGQGLLAGAAVVAGTSDSSEPRLMVGLFLLGLGWSAALVGGSTLLAESVPAGVRVRAQGISDLLMNLVGAAGAALSGVLLALVGFGGLNAVAGLLVLPPLIFAVAPARSRVGN